MMNIPMLEENAKFSQQDSQSFLTVFCKQEIAYRRISFMREKVKSLVLMQQRGENAFPVYGKRKKMILLKDGSMGCDWIASHFML